MTLKTRYGKSMLMKVSMDAKLDWGYARDYVYAMYPMLQTEQPSDHVVATGETRTVHKFVDWAFHPAEMNIE